MDELYQLPDGWELNKISSIIEKTKNKNPKVEEDTNFTYIDISSINSETYLVESPKVLLGKDAPSRARKQIVKNDIVFATTRPNLKNIAVINTAYDNPIASTGFCILRCNDNNEYKYLFNYLLSNLFYQQLEPKIRGAQYPAVSDTDVKGITIPLPPLKEQKRIVSKLDDTFSKLDRAIQLHQENIDEANAYMSSVLNEVFSELEEKYGLIKINDTVIKTKNKNPQDEQDKPFTYIDISSIDNKLHRIVEPKQLIGSEAPSRARKEVITGDVVYATTRPNLKNISIVSQEYDNPIASTGFCILRVNDETINNYLFYYLITDKLFEQIEPNIRGAQYPATSDRDLKNCFIPNTPFQVQKEVVEYLDDISSKMDKIKSLQKDKLRELKALKASILDSAFRGEL